MSMDIGFMEWEGNCLLENVLSRQFCDTLCAIDNEHYRGKVSFFLANVIGKIELVVHLTLT